MFNLFTPKIKVEIVYKNGESRIKKCKIVGNTVVIEPKKRGRGGSGWQPTFDIGSIIERKGRKLIFKVREKRLMVMESSDKCVSFDASQDKAKIPLWNRETEQKLFEANVIKAAGASTQKIKIPMAIYILIVLTFGIGFINLLLLSGRLRV